MKLRTLPLRTRALLALLAVTAGAWAYSAVDRWVLERGLHVVAKAKMGELEGEKGNSGKVLDVTSEVIATREYVVFGDAQGKVSVYMRDAVSPEVTQYHALEYFLRYDDGGWVLEDSSHNHDPGLKERAQTAFAAND